MTASTAALVTLKHAVAIVPGSFTPCRICSKTHWATCSDDVVVAAPPLLLNQPQPSMPTATIGSGDAISLSALDTMAISAAGDTSTVRVDRTIPGPSTSTITPTSAS